MSNKKLRKIKQLSIVGVGALCLIGTRPIMPAYADAPAQVTEGIASATATIESLQNLASTALTVALIPLGSMLTLRFLNMVLSRV